MSRRQRSSGSAPTTRVACVLLPALPLQIFLRQHPDWRAFPCATVNELRPEGVVLAVNARARASRVLPGQRFAAALSLCPELRAGAVEQADIQKQIDELLELYRGFTPELEPYAEVPGACWLNASGLGLLHPSLQRWAQRIGSALAERELVSRIAVGFSRFGSYAAACAGAPVTVLDSPGHERAVLRQVPLDRLELSPRSREALARLGVHSVGELLRLPAGGLRTRFGPELHRLHRLATGETGAPLQPQQPDQPLQASLLLDDAERDQHRLLFSLKRLLHPLLEAAAARSQVVAELRIRLVIERELPPREERIRPAEPTLDSRQLLELVRLRFEQLQLSAGAVELQLGLQGAPARRDQLQLFASQTRRDLAAADRALARVRAELGDQAVVCAQLREAHLPEARFRWQPLDQLPRARPRAPACRQLVRRLYDRPVLLPPRLRLSAEGWLLRDLDHGSVLRMIGPYLTSGGWWVREVQRHYHFAEMQKGQILWLYDDRVRRRWLIQGEVL